MTVGNQTALIRSDGSYEVRNISLFVSQDTGVAPQLYRARATCLRNGQMITGQSDFFELQPTDIAVVEQIFLSDLDPLPVSLSIAAAGGVSVLTLGEDIQLQVTAYFADGSSEDRTARTAGTTYLSTNSNLLTVTEEGLATGANNTVSPEPVIIAVLNEGNIGTIEFTVTGPSGDLDNDGMPNEYEILYGLDPQNAADADTDLDGDGLTNLEEFLLGTAPNDPDTDLDTVPDNLDANPLAPDENPPQLTIVSPVDSSTVGEGLRIQIEVDASDDGLLTDVELSTVDGGMQAHLFRSFGTDGPFVAPFVIPYGPTDFTFSVTARDSLGRETTQTTTVNVQPDPLTTVSGTVLDGGAPVVGASVRTIGGLATVSGAGGTFSIPNVPTNLGSVFVGASNPDGQGGLLWGSSSAAVGGATTAVGNLDLLPLAPSRTDSGIGDFVQARSFELGDIDRDGLLDAVVSGDVHSIGPRLHIALGNGDGSFDFTSTINIVKHGTTVAFENQLVDLNGDGLLDIAVACDVDALGPCGGGFCGKVSVYLGNGDGTFAQPALEFGFNGKPRALAAVELGGAAADRPDLVTGGGFFSGPKVYEALGDGRYTYRGQLGGGGQETIRPADLNGDGIQDIACSRNNGAQLYYGTGTDFAFNYVLFDIPQTNRDIAVGDLDHDGGGVSPGNDRADLVASTHIGERVYQQQGDGSFLQLGAPYVLGANATDYVSLAEIDLDPSAEADVVTLGQDRAWVLFGNGDATFQPPTSYDVGSVPVKAHVTDINFSGVPDVVVLNRDSDNVSTLLGLGGGVLQSRSPDQDADGVEEDGDGSGTAGDNPCADQVTTSCDDNCPDVYNPNQEDVDGDGLGDACDP
ncbi:MAG: hypothetical protein GY716_00595 [bacterium]|nr:hypothetical protein [bacterium]